MLSTEFMERKSDILESGELADCNFLVGSEYDQQLIASYKLILAITSPVFRAMFYGSLAEKVNPIPIPDVHPAHFKVLLNYIYTNKIKLNSLKEASGVYYCAKKYVLPKLEDLCSEYFLENIGSYNACEVYEYAQLFEDNKVMDKATEIMTEATTLVLNSLSFEKIQLNTLLHMFCLDKLCIDSEIELLEAAVRYIKVQEKLPAHNEAANKAELSIHQAVEKIRFLNVTPKQFAECKDRGLLLSESEVLSVIMNITSINTNVPYPARLCPSRVSRVQKNMSKTFSFTIRDIRNHNEFYSPRNYACDLCWRVLVKSEPLPYNHKSKEKYLGVYLNCYTNTKTANWKCKVEYEVTLLSHASTSLNHSVQFTKQFTRNQYLGRPTFMAMKQVVDPSKGFMKGGAITIQARINILEFSFV